MVSTTRGRYGVLPIQKKENTVTEDLPIIKRVVYSSSSLNTQKEFCAKSRHQQMVVERNEEQTYHKSHISMLAVNVI